MAKARSADAADQGGARVRSAHRKFRLTTIWIGVSLVAILGIAYPLGYLWHNANAARAVAIFAIGVVSFLGMLTLAHQGSGRRSFDSAEVRVAVTTSFVMVYFAVLAIFLFSTNTVSEFGRNMVDNLTSLFGVVVGFYFASSAVVEYGKARASSPPPETSTQHSAEDGAPAGPRDEQAASGHRDSD
jgi:uncharacterized membrane protein YjgN (DUF898 family)